MRIAIVSSPRSGNSWLRGLFRDSLELHEVAVHNYLDAVTIPEKCVLQLHWYREPNFQRFLAENDFWVITVARHPLDILISVLHFVRYEPETAKWLGGNCELPGSLSEWSPASEHFLEYALSFGSENLLSVTYQWWYDDSTIKVRYEDLVADAPLQVERLSEKLHFPSERMMHAMAANSIDMFKAFPNRHGWQGKPGLWRELIPFENAARIYERHRVTFERLNYTIEPTTLTRDEAEINWATLRR
jgi:hypothetical protein